MQVTLNSAFALFLQGFVAMEVAYHLGPRNFRSNSENYKYVIAMLLGFIVFALTTLISRTPFSECAKPFENLDLLTWGRLAASAILSVAVGVSWHVVFSYLVPWSYGVGRKARNWAFGEKLIPAFHGPVKVFDTAMDALYGLEVEVFLKDGRVVKGRLDAYPDMDGDSGLLVCVSAYGEWGPAGSRWDVTYSHENPKTLKSHLWISGPSIEMISGAYNVESSTSKPKS